MRPHPRLCLAGLLVAATVAATACASPAPPSQLTRIAIVTAPTAAQVQPRLSRADVDLLRAATATDTAWLDIVVAGDTAAGRHIDLTPRRVLDGGHTEVEHGPGRVFMTKATIDGLHSTLAALAPAAGTPDLLRAIGDAARLAPGGTMIVADSGVTTVDPLDLRVLGWDQDPGEIVSDLLRRGLVPDLRGWAVRFTGLGRVAGRQEPLPSPQLRWLADLWTAQCRAGGAASCTVAQPDLQDAPPTSTRQAPAVAVPDVKTVPGPAGERVTNLPASRLGFREGSWALGPDADSALVDVVAAARDGRHVVEVVGYVAFWGPEDYRAQLSTRRAQAVADRIVAAGVPAELVTAVGAGAADGAAASQNGGLFDEAKVSAAGLRRVVVTVRPSSR